MKRQIAIIISCFLFLLLLGSQLALAEGGKILFNKLIDDMWQIVVTDENGKNMQILSKSHKDDLEPSWSFDGRHIAFTSNRNGNGFDIYVMNAKGSNEYQVTNNEVWEYSPSFSPDGQRLIFSRTASIINPDPKIYTSDINGNDERYLIDGSTPKWSSDGEKIVFWKNGGIYIMDKDGRNQIKIIDNGYYPSWSPDDKYIAFTFSDGNSNEIYKIELNGNNTMCLTNGMKNAVNPSWSPDGKYIVFWDMATYSMYKVSADGGKPVSISDGICMYPSWFDPAFASYAVSPSGKLTGTWAGVKRK